MIEKKLLRFSRKQLLELLLRETERADMLENRIADTEKKLTERRRVEREVPTVADAAIQLSGITDAARNAARLYVDSIKALNERLTQTGRETDDIASRRAQAIIIDAQRQCAEHESETEEKLLQITVKLRQMYKNKKMLDELSQEHNAE